MVGSVTEEESGVGAGGRPSFMAKPRQMARTNARRVRPAQGLSFLVRSSIRRIKTRRTAAKMRPSAMRMWEPNGVLMTGMGLKAVVWCSMARIWRLRLMTSQLPPMARRAMKIRNWRRVRTIRLIKVGLRGKCGYGVV